MKNSPGAAAGDSCLTDTAGSGMQGGNCCTAPRACGFKQARTTAGASAWRHTQLTAAALAWILLIASCPSQGQDFNPDPLPNIDECDFCQRCVVEPPSLGSGGKALQEAWPLSSADSAAGGGGTQPGTQAPSSSSSSSTPGRAALSAKEAKDLLYEDPSQPAGLRASAYRIPENATVPKSSLPNCTSCRGCNTELEPMLDQSRFLDRTFTNEKGGTSGWLFRAATNRTASGTAVVKVYCMPLPKRPGARVPMCAPSTILRNMRLLLAIQQLSDECGFQDLIPRVWVDRVNAPVPGIGYHVRWHGLWMEVADGVSMENVLNKGKPSPLPPSVVLDIMQNKLNKTQVVRAAIFDLLTSQCDRHAQNIFVNEHGQIKLIDNEAALQSSWKNCGVNSILVPTTQKLEIIRMSNEFINKLVTRAQMVRGRADPQLLFDYRCYLPDGREEMGTEYPAQVKQCLADIARKSVAEVQQHYGLLEELPAANLRSRAIDMLERGFEYAAKFGKPLNADSKRYRIQPKCCKIKHERRYLCAHPWEPKYELPFGDPVTGRNWTKERRDTGSYQGGDFQ